MGPMLALRGAPTAHRRPRPGVVRAGLAAAAALLAVLAAPPGLAAHGASLRLAVSHTPLATPFYVAQALDLFRRAGVAVQVETCLGGHRCMKRLLEGGADLATASDSPIVYHGFSDPDFRVLATFVSTTRDLKLVARASAGVERPRDLAGRRVGTVTRTASHYFLDTFLVLNGVDPAAVRIVPLDPEDMAGALLDGRVDAIASWEPFGFLAMDALGADARVVESLPIYTETFNLVARPSVIETHPGQVEGVVRALDGAIRFVQENPQEAQRIVMDRLGVDRRFIDWIWPDLRFGLTLDRSLLLSLESQARWVTRRGYVRAAGIPDYLRLVHPAPLSAVRDTAVGVLP